MILFHNVCRELAERETRSFTLSASKNLRAGEYAFLEWYCDDLNCDCRRVLLEVISRSHPEQPVAHIAYGWEPRRFYEQWSNAPPKFARAMAKETVEATLDRSLPQSAGAPALLEIFREMIATDRKFVSRLARHYQVFRAALKRAEA